MQKMQACMSIHKVQSAYFHFFSLRRTGGSPLRWRVQRKWGGWQPFLVNLPNRPLLWISQMSQQRLRVRGSATRKAIVFFFAENPTVTLPKPKSEQKRWFPRLQQKSQKNRRIHKTQQKRKNKTKSQKTKTTKHKIKNQWVLCFRLFGFFFYFEFWIFWIFVTCWSV